MNSIQLTTKKSTEYCFLLLCKECGWEKNVVPNGTEIQEAVKILKKGKECGCDGSTYVKNSA